MHKNVAGKRGQFETAHALFEAGPTLYKVATTHCSIRLTFYEYLIAQGYA